MKACCQPVQQACFGLRQIHASDADLGESKPMRPLSQLHHELLLADGIDLNFTGHAAILETRTLRWADEAECAAFAQTLATRSALREACIELRGPLGAGKTTFVRHLLRALGISGRIKSPTYAVLEPYVLGDLAISHLDFYRFADAREGLDAGLRDVFAEPGLKLVEWPQHAKDLLPLADLRIHIEPETDGHRTVVVEAGTARGMALLP